MARTPIALIGHSQKHKTRIYHRPTASKWACPIDAACGTWISNGEVLTVDEARIDGLRPCKICYRGEVG